MAQAELICTADARIRDLSPDTNYGSADQLHVGKPMPGSAVFRSLVRFGLSALPSAAVIGGAWLRLYCVTPADNAGVAAAVSPVNRAWLESSLTWNEYKTGAAWTTPGGDYDPISYPPDYPFTMPVSTGWIDIAVTDLVIAGSVDVIIKVISEGPQGSRARFASREHATTAWWPMLRVVYRTALDYEQGIGRGLGRGLARGLG